MYSDSRLPWSTILAGLILGLLVAGGLGVTGCGDRPSDYVGEDEPAPEPEPAPGGGATCTLDTPTETSGDIPVIFTTSDPDNDPLAIYVQFSSNQGVSYTLCTGAASNTFPNGATGVSGPPNATAEWEFIWDSLADLGQVQITVRLRVVAADPFHPAALCTADLTVDNSPTQPTAPSCAITSPGGGTLTGDITVDYTLTDAEGDAASIQVEFSSDSGATFTAATEATGGASEGTTGLTTSAAGTAHVFVWDSGTDVPGQQTGAVPNVQVRITPSDGSGTGTSCTSASFTLDATAPANTPPSCSVTAPAGGNAANDVQVIYSLVDAESDTCSVTMRYSTDSGATFQPATEVSGSPSEGTTGLAATPAGTSHTFVWASGTDVPGQTSAAVPGVVFEITPADASLTGNACTSATFTLDPAAAGTRAYIPGSLRVTDAATSTQLNNTIPLAAGGAPAILVVPAGSTPAGVSLQLLVEASFTSGTLVEDVTTAASASGATTYAEADASVLTVNSMGLITGVAANACTEVTVTYTPDGTNATGAAESVTVAACVDLAGATPAQRAGPDGVADTADDALAVGDLDAGLAGTPDGPAPPGAGGSFSQVLYVNAGSQSLGAYSLRVDWNGSILAVDTAQGNSGVSTSVAHPTIQILAVNPMASSLIFNGLDLGVTNTAIFDLARTYWTVTAAGTTSFAVTITNLADNGGNPIPVGGTEPRAAVAAEGSLTFP